NRRTVPSDAAAHHRPHSELRQVPWTLPGREPRGRQIEARNLILSRSRHRIAHLRDFQPRIADKVPQNESHIEGTIVWPADCRNCSCDSASSPLKAHCTLQLFSMT